MEKSFAAVRCPSNMLSCRCAALVFVLGFSACSSSDSDETSGTTAEGAPISTHSNVEVEDGATSSLGSSDGALAIRVEPSSVGPGDEINVTGVVATPDDNLMVGASAGLERRIGPDWVSEWTLIEIGVGLPAVSVPGEVMIPSGANFFGTPQTFELPADLEPSDYRVCLNMIPADVDVCEPFVVTR